MTDAEYEKLRAQLLTYPGIDQSNVDQHIGELEHRAEVKAHLVNDRGFPNALAERWLDVRGHPRPPGWHAVFCYPGSNRPRNRYVLLFVMAAAAVYWLQN